MDILYHIAIFIGIGFLFYFYYHNKREERKITPLLLIALIASLGFASTWEDNTYITLGYNTTAQYNSTTKIATAQTIPIREDFTYEWALFLAYGFLIVISGMISFTGGKYGE
jgi:RsiW-degrading membrane proteinase PrsW (M82 family)